METPVTHYTHINADGSKKLIRIITKDELTDDELIIYNDFFDRITNT